MNQLICYKFNVKLRQLNSLLILLGNGSFVINELTIILVKPINMVIPSYSKFSVFSPKRNPALYTIKIYDIMVIKIVRNSTDRLYKVSWMLFLSSSLPDITIQNS